MNSNCAIVRMSLFCFCFVYILQCEHQQCNRFWTKLYSVRLPMRNAKRRKNVKHFVGWANKINVANAREKQQKIKRSLNKFCWIINVLWAVSFTQRPFISFILQLVMCMWVRECMHEVELDCRLFAGVCIILHDLDWAITFNASVRRGALSQKSVWDILLQCKSNVNGTRPVECVIHMCVHEMRIRFIENAMQIAVNIVWAVRWL